ncbi:MAG: hypothetical protein LBT56_00470, partial [Prevotellaceae bacterium]|nr:hypothetical protein [Prevotellaceae bacterium]
MQNYRENNTNNTKNIAENLAVSSILLTHTFSKQSDGNWKQEGGSGYTFRGYGQMKNVTTTDEQRKDAT